MEEGTEKPAQGRVHHRRYVRVKDGPFTDFNGTVEEVNYEKNKVVFGHDFRSCDAVELNFLRSKDLRPLFALFSSRESIIELQPGSRGRK